jgi:hypothetical protein
LGRCEDRRVPRFYRLVRVVIDLLVLRGRRDRHKDAEILVLRHQLAIVQRQIKRSRFEPDDRAIFTALARAIGRDRWCIFIVKPDTILGWHRRLIADHGTYPLRPGRPSTIVETHKTILRLARENPTWGYRRIRGELTLWVSKTRPGALNRYFVRRDGIGRGACSRRNLACGCR